MKIEKIKLPRKFRKKWLEMLVSGNYKQTKEILTNEGKYCCLGVAGRALGIKRCDLTECMPHELEVKLAFKYPKAIVEKFEQNYGEEDIEFEAKSTSFSYTLASMNDNGKSFKEIAAYIRSNTIGV